MNPGQLSPATARCSPPVSPDPWLAPPPADGHFYQKWAPLQDPRDTRAGTKGFVKVTLSVRARGDLPPPRLRCQPRTQGTVRTSRSELG